LLVVQLTVRGLVKLTLIRQAVLGLVRRVAVQYTAVPRASLRVLVLVLAALDSLFRVVLALPRLAHSPVLVLPQMVAALLVELLVVVLAPWLLVMALLVSAAKSREWAFLT
jgi:hypothetical protein